MKKLLMAATAATAILISACTEEPEVVEVDDTGLEEPAVPVVETTEIDWDTNDDGVFQETEYTAWDNQGISSWDTDGDASLTEEEFGIGWTSVGFSDSNAVFTAWDDDGDGLLSDDEFFDDEEWTEWDADGSGVLEESEFGYY